MFKIHSFSLGHGQAEGSNDEHRHDHDQLSAAGHAAKLLPQHHLKPGHPKVRHRLHARRDGQARQRPLSPSRISQLKKKRKIF